MRLICPNCGAQYEVADDVIPQAGRDVQCSNCGHTWFEKPGASVAEEHPTPVATDISEPEHEPQPAPDPEPTPEPEPEAEAPEPDPEPEPEPEPQRRELDPGVADILREEAEFERAARAAEADPIETQPEMDLSQDPDEDRRSREARDRLARLRGEQDTTTNAATAAAVGATMASQTDAPRRELLPDIEEINSTLRPDEASQPPADDIEVGTGKSGFRRGFMLMVLIALVALAAYVFAPQIAAAVPQTEAPLTTYVNWVDGLRLWLDAQIGNLVEQAGSGEG